MMNIHNNKRNIFTVCQAILNTIQNNEEHLYNDIKNLFRDMTYDPPELETLHWTILSKSINNAFANIPINQLSIWGKISLDIFTGNIEYSKICFIAAIHV